MSRTMLSLALGTHFRARLTAESFSTPINVILGCTNIAPIHTRMVVWKVKKYRRKKRIIIKPRSLSHLSVILAFMVASVTRCTVYKTKLGTVRADFTKDNYVVKFSLDRPLLSWRYILPWFRHFGLHRWMMVSL